MPLTLRQTKGSPLTTAEMDSNLTLLEGQYKGTATPSTNPTAEKGFYYLATTPGTYTNFGGQTVGHEIAYLRYTGTAWVKDVVSSLLRPGAVVGRVTSGWIHAKTLTRDSGTGVITCVIEVGANTTIEMQGMVGTAAYGASTLTLNANNLGTSVEYTRTVTTTSAPTAGTAAIAIDLTSNQPVYLAGTVSTTSRLCLLSTQAAGQVDTQRSILPSNHFFSVSGSDQQNPDTKQAQFHVTQYGASDFTDDLTPVDNSAALFYAKWAAQVVNRARKKNASQFADTTLPEIDIVFPAGLFLADFSTTKYAGSGVYAFGYWPYYEGIKLVGSGTNTTVIKHTGGVFASNIFAAESLTLYRIQPGTTPFGGATLDEVRFSRVKFYFAPGDIITGRVINNPKARRHYLHGCVFDYNSHLYAPVEISNYDVVEVIDCTFNPSRIGFHQHGTYVYSPNSKQSRYTYRGNRSYRGVTGPFTRMLRGYKPMVGTLIEDNIIEDVIEEGIAIDGIGDSAETPVIGNGLITSVTRPAVCPGEKQWLISRTLSPGAAGSFTSPVCLTDTPTTTAYAFKASSDAPNQPDTTDLTPTGWSTTIPISEDPVWMSTAPVSGGLAGTWTAPVDITEVRVFITSVSQPVAPVSRLAYPGGSWSPVPPALPHTNVWVSKARSVDGNVCGATKTWSTPVNIAAAPAEATWTEYRVATGYGEAPAEINNVTTFFPVWRTSPRQHNLVIGADLKRVNTKNGPLVNVPVTSGMSDFFFTLDDGSGREGAVCDILYADPDTNTLVLDLEAPVNAINLNGWCGVHSGAFDCVVRRNRVERTVTGISAFINCFGFLIEANVTQNCRQALRVTGQLSFSGNRCRAHNNIVRGNTFIGQAEEDNSGNLTYMVDFTNDYAIDPEHRSFNNSFTDNTVIGGRINLGFQGNLTWDNNRLIDVTEINRVHCRLALPDAASSATGQVVTCIQDDWEFLAAHVIPLASMVQGTAYRIYRYGTTDWASLASNNAVPPFNSGFTYNGTTPSGTGQVMPNTLAPSSMVAGGRYRVNSVGTTNWTELGAAVNAVNATFIYNGFVPTSWGNGAVWPYFEGKPTSVTYHACKLVNGVYSWVEV